MPQAVPRKCKAGVMLRVNPVRPFSTGLLLNSFNEDLTFQGDSEQLEVSPKLDIHAANSVVNQQKGPLLP